MKKENLFKEKDNNTLSVQARIENKVTALMADMKPPTKVYLGKKEYSEFLSASGACKKYLPAAHVGGKILKQVVASGELNIVATKHRSYFRVV